VIVLDASVLVAAAAAAGADGAWAEAVLADRRLIAPSLVLVEATQAVRKLERLGLMAPALAAAVARDLVTLPIEFVPFEPLAGRIWQLRRNLTAYDAWYVAAAEVVGAPLATLDRRLTLAAGPRCKFWTPPAS
jgi:predicted nucleic acid-binding protein